MTDEAKIEQLRKQLESDPNNELAQFALGNALLDAGRHDEAGPCFQRVLAVNSRNSRAYQRLGMVQELTGHPDLAIQTLTNGYRVAHRQGDLQPLKEMETLLVELGAEIPKAAAPPKKPKTASPGDGSFSCRRCGGQGPALEKRPFKGELGEIILGTVCAGCWREWVGMGTKVINELRLPMYDPQAQELYDQHMKEFLLID